MACAPPYMPVIDASTADVPLYCGEQGGPCCANDRCRGTGSACAHVGDARICVACGYVGSPCCFGTTCDVNSVCTRSAPGHEGQPFCSACAALNQPCCTMGTPCGGSLACTRDQVCHPCGGRGEPCCAFDTCESGAACSRGVCEPCGGAGESCCRFSTCAGGIQCVAGRCATCGSSGQPCCADSRCYVGSCVGGQCLGTVNHGLYAHCRMNSDCAIGLTCNLSYPGGLCTQRCSSDRACGPTGICAGSSGCLPACDVASDDCARYGGVCLSFDANDLTRRACYPSCDVAPSQGTPACELPRTCNAYSGACEAPPHSSVGMGENGDRCAVGSDCRGGRCFREVLETGTPTGFLGGYCVSFARAPTESAYVPGAPWPRGNCPEGTVPWSERAVPEGGPVACARSCVSDSDCRVAEGYVCTRGPRLAMTGMPAFTTGACVPINCRDGTHVCPGGARCADVPGSMPLVGRCVSTGDPDAGAAADAASDGSVPESSVPVSDAGMDAGDGGD